MQTGLTAYRKAILFYVVALLLCAGVSGLAPILGDRAPIVAMFTPLVSVLLVMLVFTPDGYTRAGWRDLGLHRAGLRGWPLALMLPLGLLAFSYGCVWLSGVAAFAAPARANGMPPFVIGVIASILVVTATVALAEEIGWRGYLLPHLTALGERRALVLSGLLQGVWHLPVLLGTPSTRA